MISENAAMNELLAFQRQTEALSSIAERLSWDQETVMPRGAVEQRSEEMAAIEADAGLGGWASAHLFLCATPLRQMKCAAACRTRLSAFRYAWQAAEPGFSVKNAL